MTNDIAFKNRHAEHEQVRVSALLLALFAFTQLPWRTTPITRDCKHFTVKDGNNERKLLPRSFANGNKTCLRSPAILQVGLRTYLDHHSQPHYALGQAPPFLYHSETMESALKQQDILGIALATKPTTKIPP